MAHGMPPPSKQPAVRPVSRRALEWRQADGQDPPRPAASPQVGSQLGRHAARRLRAEPHVTDVARHLDAHNEAFSKCFYSGRSYFLDGFEVEGDEAWFQWGS